MLHYRMCKTHKCTSLANKEQPEFLTNSIIEKYVIYNILKSDQTIDPARVSQTVLYYHEIIYEVRKVQDFITC